MCVHISGLTSPYRAGTCKAPPCRSATSGRANSAVLHPPPRAKVGWAHAEKIEKNMLITFLVHSSFLLDLHLQGLSQPRQLSQLRVPRVSRRYDVERRQQLRNQRPLADGVDGFKIPVDVFF